MSSIIIICVGKLDKSYWQAAALDFLNRLKHEVKVQIHYVADVTSGNIANNIKIESSKIKALLVKYSSYQQYLLDLTGELFSSEAMAQLITNNQTFYQGKLLFIIGGSNGVDATIKNHQNIKKLALAKITFPHQLCQVILLEQIYRAYQIIGNKPYHK